MRSVCIIGGALVVVACSRESQTPAQFVGTARCASCHAPEHTAWKTSQHAVAMQDATPATVLGRFDSTRFEAGGVTSTFLRRGDQFVVNTEGADGQRHDYVIRSTFGVYPRPPGKSIRYCCSG